MKGWSSTAVEFRILRLLASKKGWVFSRDTILDHLWGHDKIVSERTVDVHVRHLRENWAGHRPCSRMYGASDTSWKHENTCFCQSSRRLSLYRH